MSGEATSFRCVTSSSSWSKSAAFTQPPLERAVVSDVRHEATAVAVGPEIKGARTDD